MEYNQDQYGQPANPATQKKPQNNMALASMIVGILALISCCTPPLQFLLGITALLLAVFSKKGQPFSGFAIAGLILSILSLIISFLMVLYIVWAFKLMSDPQYAPILDEVMELYQQMYSTP